MPRDYKHHVTRRRKRRTVSPWLGLAAGLLIGLFAAAIAYMKFAEPPQQNVAAPAFAPEDRETPEEPADEKEAKQEEKASVPPPAKPRFDFYTILPKMEVTIPEEDIGPQTAPAVFKPVDTPATTAPESKPEVSPEAIAVAKPVIAVPQSQPIAKPATSSGGNYFLQSDTYRVADQAERLKAQLALLGLQASVQNVTLNKNTIHRVRVGPFPDFSTLEQARALMRRHGIQSTPVMIRK